MFAVAFALGFAGSPPTYASGGRGVCREPGRQQCRVDKRSVIHHKPEIFWRRVVDGTSFIRPALLMVNSGQQKLAAYV